MSNTSYAAQAVANGPMTAAPPSFDGHGWLVAINLGLFTAAAIIGAMLAWDQVKHIWRNRKRDLRGHPVTIWRLTGLCWFSAIALRSGIAAATLWRWSPTDPVGTAAALTMQRFVDPVALSLAMAGMVLFTLSSRGVVEQLRRQPLPIRMWLSMPMLRRPLYILFLSLAAAIGVVTLR